MEIAIPSKGRAKKVETLTIFPEAILFVEPQDYNLYKESYPKNKIININKNDQGISYVRNFILNYFTFYDFSLSIQQLQFMFNPTSHLFFSVVLAFNISPD